MISRRHLIAGSAILAGAGAVSGRVQAAAIPEAVVNTSPAMQPPLAPASGPDYQPVVTLNGWTLPWRMNGDWKEFHLVAEPVEREFAPGMTVHLWGYNGQSPGLSARKSTARIEPTGTSTVVSGHCAPSGTQPPSVQLTAKVWPWM